MSDLSPLCAPKRTFADHFKFMDSRPSLEGKSGIATAGAQVRPNSDLAVGILTPLVVSVSLIAHAAASVPGAILPDHPKGLVRAVPSRTESC